ncbi:MAG: hypothetical protein AVDCRST_MAG73-2919, partial [uncultured Thermomicrobiales bacterium]
GSTAPGWFGWSTDLPSPSRPRRFAALARSGHCGAVARWL